MRKKLVITGVLIIAAIIALWFWPSPHYDISRVHPTLRSLAAPYRSVFTSYFLDGGSIGVHIVDRDGHTALFALPVGTGRTRTYPRLFVGATHASNSNAVEVAFTEDTRRMLVSVIDEHRTAADSSDIALVYLRGTPRDVAHILGLAAAKLYKSVVS